MILGIKILILFSGLFFSMGTWLFAQQDAVQLKIKPADAGFFSLNEHPWRFHSGDDPSWAKPDIDDGHWDTFQPNFGSDNLPKGWKGYGWFRLWVRKDSLSSTATWGLYLNHDGASELYWDGQKIEGIGTFSTSEKDWVAKRDPYAVLPVAITDTLPHLIAIRYCNYRPAFSDFVGFQLWAGDMHTMNVQRKENQHFMDFQLLSGAAQAILILLHLLLFVFYPKNKVNLYYSLFVLSTSTVLYFRYLTIVTTSPYIQVFAWKAFFAMTIIVNVTQLLLLYSVSYRKLPMWRLWLFGGISLVLIGYRISHLESILSNSSPRIWDWMTAAVALLAFAEGARAIIGAIRKGNKRLWLIAVGMVVVGILSLVVGMNIFGWFNLRQVLTAMGFATLIIPVLFSIYLALDVADTNRKLARQLEENEVLSARALEQEQERTRFMEEQAERLEQTVLERTAQVRAQAEKLREMDAVKSRFFVNLTHEFKTPLTLIANPAKELLKQAYSEEGKQYARYILQNSDRLLQLINQLLDLSKLESGQLDIQTEPIEMVNWLRTHVQQYHSLTEQKQIDLFFSSNVDELWIASDLDKMEKIVQNLLSNAIKFIDHKGSIAITLNKKENDSFDIIVADTGIGIPQDKLPYVFDRFYQVDASDTRAKEGAGIGLALTKELTELLGGSICVESKEGKGATFTVSFPYTKAAKTTHMTAAPQQERVMQSSNPSVPSDGLRDELPVVLVVEDHADLRHFIRFSLAENYTVITASDGAKGIDTALEQIPTLVITDLMMPEKDGYQVCHTLKTDERTSHIPIIMLTAKTDRDSRVRGIEIGADAYLAKPFDKRELLALMENLIRVRKQLREKYGKGNVWLTEAATLPAIEKIFLERVRHVVETRLDDDQLGPEQLGKDIGLSRTQLHRKLKGLMDQSPGELIRTIRMQRAHELLQHKVATVAEVCYMVGYANPANFSTSFSKHFGYPPSEVVPI